MLSHILSTAFFRLPCPLHLPHLPHLWPKAVAFGRGNSQRRRVKEAVSIYIVPAFHGCQVRDGPASSSKSCSRTTPFQHSRKTRTICISCSIHIPDYWTLIAHSGSSTDNESPNRRRILCFRYLWHPTTQPGFPQATFLPRRQIDRGAGALHRTSCDRALAPGIQCR